jgi:hypothetical protein
MPTLALSLTLTSLAVIARGGASGPLYDFTKGLPPALAALFFRSGLGTTVDAAGNVVYGDHNILRRSDDLSALWSFDGGATNVGAGNPIDGYATARLTGSVTLSGAWQTLGGTFAVGDVVVYECYVNRISGPMSLFIRFFNQGGIEWNQSTLTLTETNASGTQVLASGWEAVPGGYRIWMRHRFSAGGTHYAYYNFRSNIGATVGDFAGWIVRGPNRLPYVRTAANEIYIPRITHNPVTLASQGLLVEAQGTNLVSTNFANWTAFRTNTITVDGDGWSQFTWSGSAPGSFGAFRQDAPTWIANQTYAYACDIKPDQATQTIRFDYVNTASGFVGGTSEFAFTGSGASCAITNSGGAVGYADPLGGGAWRCWIVFTITASPNYHYIALGQFSGVVGGSSFKARFPQLEIGLVPTSRIPNPGTGTVVRTQDGNWDITGAPFTALWGAGSERTIIVEWWDTTNGADISYDLFGVNTTNADRIVFYKVAGSPNFVGLVTVGGVNLWSFALGTVIPGGRNKLAFSVTGSQVYATLNGASPVTNTVATPPVNKARIAGSQVAIGDFRSTLASLDSRPTALTGAALQALSAL